MIGNGRDDGSLGRVPTSMQLDSSKPNSTTDNEVPSALPLQGDRPIAVDLFAGAGGMSLGFEQAGFDVVAAVEIDPIHAAVHRFNFPNCAVLARSVEGLSASDIRKAANIGERSVDVVFGGAPCQGFSLIGKRAIDDPRNNLVREFVRITRELGASSFVFENVKGLTLGTHRQFLDELIAEFEAAGYCVQKSWQVLNATSYGVPQDRDRLILMGSKKKSNLPHYPAPTTRHPNSKRSLFDIPPGPTCKDALGDLPNADDFYALMESDCVETDAWGIPSDYAARLRCVDSAGWWFGHVRIWNPKILTSSIRTVHTDISKLRFSETLPGSVEPISRFFKLPPDGVSNTLRAGTDAARGAFTSPRPIHYLYPRCITVREMARLHGYPDWFRFHSTKWHGARQVGNSVPPPMARAVASAVLQALGKNPSRPKEAVNLGDPSWLHLVMEQATELFGLERRIVKRDQKSGAKKRKQEDIEKERLAAKERTNG